MTTITTKNHRAFEVKETHDEISRAVLGSGDLGNDPSCFATFSLPDGSPITIRTTEIVSFSGPEPRP